MPEFLSYKFEDSPAFVNTFDELPLWSSYFGILLLKHVELKRNLTVLDIGSGAGFPLLELAQRLGNSCVCYGIDPWINANARVAEKIKNYGIKNVSIIAGTADEMPFDDASVDLIVSNLGINNFTKPEAVFTECRRTLKPGGRLALTTNLNGHWQQFYDIFAATLRETGNGRLTESLNAHQAHRGTVQSVSAMFSDAGLKVTRFFEDSFSMHFLDGTAFMNHYFVKLGWLASWKDLIPETEQAKLFGRLEENLNSYASANGGLSLTVPMAYIEGEKI